VFYKQKWVKEKISKGVYRQGHEDKNLNHKSVA